MDESDTVILQIDGTLDLHTFLPREIGTLIPDYLGECRKVRILQVRIIHGKGHGILQRRVHSILKTLSYVISFRLADESGGGWGATLVQLSPPDRDIRAVPQGKVLC